MRGNWNLRDWEVEYWQTRIQRIIDFELPNTDYVYLTNEDINPYQVEAIFESLGWEEVDMADTNGWEQDRWNYFKHPDYPGRTLGIFSCGLTFELKIYFVDEEEI